MACRQNLLPANARPAGKACSSPTRGLQAKPAPRQRAACRQNLLLAHAWPAGKTCSSPKRGLQAEPAPRRHVACRQSLLSQTRGLQAKPALADAWPAGKACSRRRVAWAKPALADAWPAGKACSPTCGLQILLSPTCGMQAKPALANVWPAGKACSRQRVACKQSLRSPTRGPEAEPALANVWQKQNMLSPTCGTTICQTGRRFRDLTGSLALAWSGPTFPGDPASSIGSSGVIGSHAPRGSRGLRGEPWGDQALNSKGPSGARFGIWREPAPARMLPLKAGEALQKMFRQIRGPVLYAAGVSMWHAQTRHGQQFEEGRRARQGGLAASYIRRIWVLLRPP